MGNLLRVMLFVCVVVTAIWFGGTLLWLWLVLVGLPAGGDEVALQSLVAINSSVGGTTPHLLAGVSVALMLVAAVISWSDRRGTAAFMLLGAGGLMAGVLATRLVFAQDLATATAWANFGGQAAMTALICAALTTIAFLMTAFAIWAAARSRFILQE